MPKQPVIVFDVNETLLDLDALHPTLDRVFGDPAALRLWFAHLITYSEALTLAGVYVPFTDIGAAVLRMLAATREITIRDEDAAELTDRFATMPPHPEVPAALRRLRKHGFRLAPGVWFGTDQRGVDRPEEVVVDADPGRPVNINIRPFTAPIWRETLLFRDWLRTQREERDCYAALKRGLARRAGSNVDDYSTDKMPWISAALSRAEQWAGRSNWSP